jgi:hypothetical protein
LKKKLKNRAKKMMMKKLPVLKIKKKKQVKKGEINMKNKTHLILSVFLLLGLFLSGYAAPGQADEDDGILLTWQDMWKLLDLDSDKIKLTWKEFQKLLEQSGNQIDMNFEIEGGIVTIKRDRFKQILKKMKPVDIKKPAPPKDYLVTEAKYTGTAGEKNSRFALQFKIYVFERESLSYISIPVLSTNTAVSSIFVDGAPGVVHTVGSWYTINLVKKGYHEIKATFSTGNNNQSLSLPIIRSMINTVDFTVPFKDFEINLNSALNVQLAGGVSSRIIAHIPPTNRMSVKWHRKSKKKEKKPALFYADTHSLISLGPDILKIRTQVDLEVLQSSLDNISLRVPANHEVVNVAAGSIKDWQVRDTDVGRILEIHFGFDIDNRFQFTVFTERMLAADTLAVEFTGLQVVDARRETGAVGIVAEKGVEVEVQSNRELEKLEFHQLPKKILAMSSRPVLYSYKYSRHPYRLDIGIHKHEQLPGISTVIESVNGTALFLQEGKMLYKMVYSIRNSYKQFMELELPEDEDITIWTVMVDNKREKASRNKKGKILIPLVRSTGNGDRLRSFNVQLIYTQPGEEFRIRGGSQCFFPKTDIFINKIRMEMFLPEGYSYDFDKGEWKEEVTPLVPVKKPVGSQEMVGLDEKPGTPAPPAEKELEEFEPRDKVQPVEGDIATGKEILSKLKRKGKKEKRLSFTGPAGLSSISVYLPISGKKYVFSKKIIDKYEAYPLKFSYFHKQALGGIYLLSGIILLLVLSFFIYKRLKSSRENRG